MTIADTDDSQLEPTSTHSPKRATQDAIYCRYAKADRRLIIVAVILIGLVNFGFIVEEWEVPRESLDNGRIVIMRALLLALSLAFASWIPFIRSTPFLQKAILLWQLVSSTLFVWTDHLLPLTAHQNSLADLAYLIAIFIFMPNRLTYQFISGAYFATIHVLMLFNHEHFSSQWWEAALIFPITVICGIYLSWSVHHTRMAEFQQWRGEYEARIKLQSAIDKIKTLRGLLPICAYCKKVRDDKGYWHEVESFIRDHSPAEFSHSLCPECGQEHYPGILGAEDFNDSQGV
ncbi:hypothetical protein [Cerasicoccus arenae]|uniref:Uncharacterized protein n=1 Tax=Cerasicoccus arenae TaxID=424488 RepID=A0A8J3DEW2_9BACT|nr:hypothetical protein [Cerasicoccus arenae]MBK1858307.1 hypothetical protein [Cerasicoccus arenae]GHB90667.1 hypothetical protein GCM10007047_01830 [Cerasicoccus arenae]